MTSSTSTAAAPLRARPIPDPSPPVLTDAAPEPAPDSTFVQGTLAFSLATVEDEFFGPQPTAARDLPDPQTWVANLAQALVEVMSGTRPAPQVIRWTSPEVYSAVARRSAMAARRQAVRHTGGGSSPGLPPRPGRRAVVRRVRICEPADGVVEACAVVVDAGRVRALALRLVGVDRRWLVTELQVG
jgi:hypothetical protein